MTVILPTMRRISKKIPEAEPKKPAFSSFKPKTRGERVIAFIEKYCRVPEGTLIGQPMRLLPFERKFILDVYDNPNGTKRGILSMGRKNGKTSLLACLVLAHLVGPEAKTNSQVVSGAQSRDQAALIFSLASKMVRMSEVLSGLVRLIPSIKKMLGIARNVEYKALSADAKRNHGLSPSFAVLDELGQVRGPKDDFVDAVTTSQGAYEDSLLIVISTQACSEGDLLSLWIDDALTFNDPRTVCHLYTADEECEVLDEEQWKKANPALGVYRSLEELRAKADEAQRMPSQESTFRNLVLNQRVETISPFVSRQIWKDAAHGFDEEAFRSSLITAGLDLSARIDLTSLVLSGKVIAGPQRSRIYLKSFFWTPEVGLVERSKRDRAPYDLWVKQGYLMTTPGGSVDYAFVAKFIGELLKAGINISKLAFDRWRIDLFKKELERQDIKLEMVPFGQGFKDFSPALDEFETGLVNGDIIHNNNPVLTYCMMNSRVLKDEAGNRKLDKKRSGGRIDGAVAATMAVGSLIQQEEKQPEYQMLFV